VILPPLVFPGKNTSLIVLGVRDEESFMTMTPERNSSRPQTRNLNWISPDHKSSTPFGHCFDHSPLNLKLAIAFSHSIFQTTVKIIAVWVLECFVNFALATMTNKGATTMTQNNRKSSGIWHSSQYDPYYIEGRCTPKMTQSPISTRKPHQSRKFLCQYRPWLLLRLCPRSQDKYWHFSRIV